MRAAWCLWLGLTAGCGGATAPASPPPEPAEPAPEPVASPPDGKTVDGFDRFVGLTTFEDLQTRRASRTVRWTAPDGTGQTLDLVELPIPVDEGIRAKTAAFVEKNYGRSDIWLDPKMIVLHSMDLGDLQQTLEASSFLHDEMPQWASLRDAGLLPNGAHFVVDRDGTVYCLTPPVGPDGETASYEGGHRWLVRRHQDGNPTAIGIENLTPKNGDFTDLTPEQIAANARLVQWLVSFEVGRIRYVVGHHQTMDPGVLERMGAAVGVRFAGAGATTGRTDPGQAVVDAVVEAARGAGYDVTSEF